MRILAIAIASMAASAAHAEEITVSAFALPTRSVAPDALDARTRSVAEDVARRLHATMLPRSESVSLEPLDRGRKLAVSRSIDQAAALLDGTLEDLARAPDSIGPSGAEEVIAASVARANLAMTRGEVARARTILSRLLRYDAGFTLTVREQNPQLDLTFSDLSAAPLEAGDLGETCRGADVVIVGHAGAHGAIQIDRYDACRRVASVQSDNSSAARLARMVPAKLLAVRAVQSARRMKIGGAVVAATGLVLVGVGAYFAADAVSRASNISHGCSATTPCAEATISARDNTYRHSATAAAVLMSIGGAALITGTVVAILGAGRAKSTSTLASALRGTVSF